MTKTKVEVIEVKKPGKHAARNAARRQRAKDAIAVETVVSGRIPKGSTAHKAHVKPANNIVRNVLRKEAAASGHRFTAFGAKWMERATNPCAVDVVCYGIPDDVSANVLTPSEREFYDVKPNDGVSVPIVKDSSTPPKLVPGTFNENELYNIISIVDASNLCHSYAIYQGDLNAPTYLALAHKDFILRDHIASGVSTDSRVCYFGSTMEFTGTITTDQGEVVVAQLKPEYAAVADNVYAWPLVANTTSIVPAATDPDDILDRMVALKKFLSQLSIADPQAITHRAEHGYYTPNRFTNPVISMKQHSSATADKQDRYMDILQAATIGYPNAASATQVKYADPYDMNCTIAHFTGLSSQASFRLKTYIGMEMLVEPGSPMMYYAHPSPDSDPNAVEMVHHVLKQMPSAYPAEANAFGWLKKAWDKVKGVATSVLKPMLPSLGAAAGNLVAPGVGGLVGNKLGSFIGNHVM